MHNHIKLFKPYFLVCYMIDDERYFGLIDSSSSSLDILEVLDVEDNSVTPYNNREEDYSFFKGDIRMSSDSC